MGSRMIHVAAYLVGLDAIACNDADETLPKPMAKTVIPAALASEAAVSGVIVPALWLPSVSSTITRGNVEFARLFVASTRPAAMFVAPSALYPLSAASSAARCGVFLRR